MGAAVSVEIGRPADGSDMTTFELARDELLRLRQSLGHLAKDNGFAEVVYDGSDLIHGMDDQQDFDRCKAEVVHIRACLRLSTQNAKRRARPDYAPTSFFDTEADDNEDEDEDDSDEEDVELENSLGSEDNVDVLNKGNGGGGSMDESDRR
jgi:hypothetical protein